jgi:hypothetical protein
MRKRKRKDPDLWRNGAFEVGDESADEMNE